MADTKKSPASDEARAEQEHGKPLQREFVLEIDRAALAARAKDDTSETIPIALSSETAVERWDWMTGETYLEILDHGPDSVDLSYARDGLPFCFEHNRRDQRGLLENVRVDPDRRLRGDLRFSRNQQGQELRNDIVDGIRKKVSVGYWPGDNYEQTKAADGKMPTRRYYGWMPMETSSVSIPADYEVGVGRAGGGASGAQPPHRSQQPASQAREFPVAQDQNTGAQPTSAGPSREQIMKDAAEIRRMASAAKLTEQETDALLERGITPDQAARELFQRMGATIKPIPTTPQPVLDISPKEKREFSLGRAVKAMVDGNWRAGSYEREVSDALSRALGRSTEGILLPTDSLFKRTVLTTDGATTGQDLVFTAPGQYIDFLANSSVVISLSPMRLTGLRANVALPRKTAMGSAGWYAENPGADFSESNLTLDQVVFSPKTLAQTESYSKQLFAQSDLAVDALIRQDIFGGIALKYDVDAMHGDGLADNITGLYSLTGVNSVAMGGAISYAKVVDMEAGIEADNAALDAMAYVTTPEIKGKARTKEVFAGTNGQPLWTGGVTTGEMNGIRSIASNQVSKTLGAGTDHGILLGAWTQAIIADWGAVEITVDPYTRSRRGVVNITGIWLADFNTRHPESFCKGTGLTNT
jgi:HK97 family phage major capsid protein